MSETSTKPYLIRAIHDWCTDNGYTPYLAVAVTEQTIVPREYVRQGEIVLNVSLMATGKLNLGNDFVEFQARFNGIARDICVPIGQVTAIYARETGHGMAFEVDKLLGEPVQDEPAAGPVSAGLALVGAEAAKAETASPAPELVQPPDDPPRPQPGRPMLKRIK
jgi:stringent starvation protein B